MTNKKVLGTVMIIVACTFWGISGLFAKALFNVRSSINSKLLTQTRMISAGVNLLIISQCEGECQLQHYLDVADPDADDLGRGDPAHYQPV